MRHILPTLPALVAFERPDRTGGGRSPADGSEDEPALPSEAEWDASMPSALDAFLAEGGDPDLPTNSVPEEAAAPVKAAPLEPAPPREPALARESAPPRHPAPPQEPARPHTPEASSRAVAGSFDPPPVAPRISATDAFSQRFPGWDDQPGSAVAGDLFAAPPGESRVRQAIDRVRHFGVAAFSAAMSGARRITTELKRSRARRAATRPSKIAVPGARAPAAARSRTLVIAAVAVIVVIAAALAWRASTSAPGGPSGTLTVTSRPAGATFLIDGREQGTTPATMSVSAGEHLLEIRSRGPTQIVSLNMADGGQISRYFDLPAGTAGARLQVNTTPSGAVVSIDGRRRGKSPLVVSDLNPGPHRVRAAIDTQSLERTVMMESGANGAVRLAFDNPNATPPPGHGFFAVTASIELRAFDNGKPVGMTRAVPWLLSAGHHELDFVNELLGVRERRAVDIREGRLQGLEIAVAPAVLSVTTSVPAEIAIDGAALGASPVVRHTVTAGQHDVIVRHPVLGERRLLVTVLPGGAVDVHVDLDRR